MDFNQIGKHCEVKADSTLNNMKKEELIRYIRMLEHNHDVAVDFNIQQVRNFEKIEKRIIEELEGSAITMSTESVPHKYFKAVGIKRAVEIVKRGGLNFGKCKGK